MAVSYLRRRWKRNTPFCARWCCPFILNYLWTYFGAMAIKQNYWPPAVPTSYKKGSSMCIMIPAIPLYWSLGSSLMRLKVENTIWTAQHLSSLRLAAAAAPAITSICCAKPCTRLGSIRFRLSPWTYPVWNIIQAFPLRSRWSERWSLLSSMATRWCFWTTK